MPSQPRRSYQGDHKTERLRVKWFRRYHPDKYFLRISTPTVTLTLRTAIQINCHATLRLLIIHHCTPFGYKMFKSSGDVEKKNLFFRIRARTVTLILKTGTQPFRMTLRVMMMHHHSKHGCIPFSDSEDIFLPTDTDNQISI